MKNSNRLRVKYKETEIDMPEKIANRFIALGWGVGGLFGLAAILKGLAAFLETIKGW